VMMPAADIFNHRASYVSHDESAMVRGKAMEWRFEGNMSAGEGQFNMYAKEGYRPCEQVFSSYGEVKANFQLLSNYAFVVDRNAFESTTMLIGESSFTEAFQETANDLFKDALENMENVTAVLTMQPKNFQDSTLSYFRQAVLSPQVLGELFTHLDDGLEFEKCSEGLDKWAPAWVEARALQLLLTMVQLQAKKVKEGCEHDGLKCGYETLASPLPVHTRFAILFGIGQLNTLELLEIGIVKVTQCLIGSTLGDLPPYDAICSDLLQQLPADAEEFCTREAPSGIGPTALAVSVMAETHSFEVAREYWTSSMEQVIALCSSDEQSMGCQRGLRIIEKAVSTESDQS